jgi:hypothetical protein
MGWIEWLAAALFVAATIAFVAWLIYLATSK